MTPDLQTLTPAERARVVAQYEAALNLRLLALTLEYERRWADEAPRVREWLYEMMRRVLINVRGDVIAIVDDVLAGDRVPWP